MGIGSQVCCGSDSGAACVTNGVLSVILGLVALFNLCGAFVGAGPFLPVGSAVEPACTHPLTDLPDGWIVLPQGVFDSVPGGYHDAVSGAFVEFDAFLSRAAWQKI